ncbi:MAG: hypothetical protein ABI968_14705 [Acidobacteriota bacterium]
MNPISETSAERPQPRPKTVSSEATGRSASDSSLRRLEGALSAVALIIAACLAWRTRFRVNSDAMNYLDLGDAIYRGEWPTAINGLWSPLYPALLGLARRLLRPSGYWESTMAHGLNLALYGLALIGFRSFFRRLRLAMRREAGDANAVTWPERSWTILGYTVFLGCSLVLIRISVLSPDLLVAALVYFAASILLTIAAGNRRAWTFAALGVVLGLGYLAKTPMFWGSVLFLAAAFFVVRDWRKAAPRVALAAGLFLVIAGLYFVPLSMIKGRPTIGDTARLNYGFHIHKVPYVHWQGDTAGNGSPRHPTRRLMTSPDVYEFASPVGGTYPPWYDPSYWYEGLRFAWKPADVRRLTTSLLDLYFMFTDTFQVSLLVGLLVVTVRVWDRDAVRRVLLRRWYVVLPAVGVLLMYSLVHVEPRYLSAFAALLWLGLYSGMALGEAEGDRRWLAAVALAVIGGMLFEMTGPLVVATESEQQAAVDGHLHWRVARELQKMGIRPEDPIASAGSGNTAYWARLAGLKVVAETRWRDDLWTAPEPARAAALRALASTGARGIVSRELPPASAASGWQPLGDTGFAYLRLGRP